MCKTLTVQNFETSSLHSETKSWVDVRIYPTLSAPNAVELLDGATLKDVFDRFVLRDPEVEMLGRRAIKINPDLSAVYIEGRRMFAGGAQWPVVFKHGDLAGGVVSGSVWAFMRDTPLPTEIQVAADALCERFEALLKLFRQEKLVAIGDPVRSRDSDRVLTSIWSHRSYYIDAWAGDILQVNEKDHNSWLDHWVKRWRAVLLKRPQRFAVFPVKPSASDGIPDSTIEPQTGSMRPRVHNHAEQSTRRKTPQRASVEAAITALWDNKIPETLQVQLRDQQINDWQRKNGSVPANGRTIRRYLSEK